MKILFDIRVVQFQAKRGIGRYVQSVLEELLKDEDIRISFLVTLKAEIPDFIKRCLKKNDVYVYENFDNYDIKKQFDFFFSGCPFMMDPLISSTSNISSITDTVLPPNIIKYCAKKVAILYDLIPMDYAGEFLADFSSQKIYSIYFETLNKFDHLFTISMFTKDDAMRFIKRPETDFTPIWGGANKSFMVKNSKYIPSKRNNNIVDISGNSISKGYVNLAKAFAKALYDHAIPNDSKLYLICACNDIYINNVQQAVAQYKVEVGKHIIITNYIPDNEVIKIVGNARALVHPSYIEGLGLPILEAYAMGTPAFGSNCTAVKEFLMPEASFDPNLHDGLYNKIVELYNNDDLCLSAYQYGLKLLKKYKWEKTAILISQKLKKLCAQDSMNKTAIFLAGSGAIAEYTVKIHSEKPEHFDIFADIENYQQWEYLRSKHVNAEHIVFPLSAYQDAEATMNYTNKIFVLGNSQHHKKVFDLACKTKGEDNRWLILHEAFVFGCMLDKFDFNLEKVKDFFILWYPELEKELRESPTNLDCLEMVLLKHGYCCIRPLIHMTGIRNIIVYSKKAEFLIRQELNSNELKEIKLFSLPLPFEPIKSKIKKSSIIKKKPKYLVGTFGFPHDMVKRSADVIKAVEILSETMDIQLIMAGNGVINYKNSAGKNIILVEAPSAEEWQSLMNSIDLGIQLREHGHGFSSACVTELLGLGKQCLLTEGMVDKKWGCLCDFIPEDLSVQEIAEAIKTALLSKKKVDNSLYAYYSFHNNAEIINNFIMGK